VAFRGIPSCLPWTVHRNPELAVTTIEHARCTSITLTERMIAQAVRKGMRVQGEHSRSCDFGFGLAKNLRTARGSKLPPKQHDDALKTWGKPIAQNAHDPNTQAQSQSAVEVHSSLILYQRPRSADPPFTRLHHASTLPTTSTITTHPPPILHHLPLPPFLRRRPRPRLLAFPTALAASPPPCLSTARRPGRGLAPAPHLIHSPRQHRGPSSHNRHHYTHPPPR